jgi:threonyl-tRNA synthetase
VAVRKRKSKETRVMPVEDFLRELKELIETKALDAE